MNATTITAEHDGHPFDTPPLAPRKEAPMIPISPFPAINRSIDADPRAPDSPSPPGAEAPSIEARRPVARCADGNGTLTGLFFSDHVVDIARAKAMCGLCPLREPCLAGALEREEPWGVWGGELLSGGRIVANKRPCGRPPKRPRPDVVYDEMGPVGVVA